MGRSDTVGVRGKIVELGGPLVPIASALPALVAHVWPLCGMSVDRTTPTLGPFSGPVFWNVPGLTV